MASTYYLMRNFIALMRSFGYPRIMSIENFRYPNFPLMADVLLYLLKRFDPSTELEANVNTEQERLKFVMAASHLMVNKANLDINVKKLYMADVNSVQEMIKLAKLIQEAWTSLNRKDAILEEDETEIESGIDHSTALSQFNSFKTTQITSEIFQVATKLYDAIAEHDKNMEHLQKSLGRQLAIDQIESFIRQSIRQIQQEMVDMQNRQEVLDRDNEDMNGKIEKRMAELNRNKKRLQTLRTQRPAYMDELEKIEEEIVNLYDQYVVNSRSLSFLEQKLEEFEELERLKIEERNKEIKQMLEQIKIEDFLKNGTLSGSQNGGGDERSSTNDDLALIVDIDEDAMGRVSGSDFSDKDINEIPRNSDSRRERQKTDVAQHKLRSDKKDRLLMANTVTVKSQRLSGVKQLQQQQSRQTPSTNNRSAKTARVYGSLMENEDDEDDSKSDAKMSDSEIDLDAIDDTDDDDDSENSAMIDFDKSVANGEMATNHRGGLKIPNFNHENKMDDNF